MNKVARKFNAAKAHVHHHRAKYAAAGTLIVLVRFDQKRRENWNEFLEENNLTDKFYNPDNEN